MQIMSMCSISIIWKMEKKKVSKSQYYIHQKKKYLYSKKFEKSIFLFQNHFPFHRCPVGYWSEQSVSSLINRFLHSLYKLYVIQEMKKRMKKKQKIPAKNYYDIENLAPCFRTNVVERHKTAWPTPGPEFLDERVSRTRRKRTRKDMRNMRLLGIWSSVGGSSWHTPSAARE